MVRPLRQYDNNLWCCLFIGRVEHSQIGTADAKIVPDKAQSDDNADALARFATQYGAILASAVGTGLFFAASLVKIDA
ncbi:hypothetical protein ACTXP0_05760 [Psychrobacter celer]|uniref:hypothetical protein n=1 Tax=Psychrobacter celer TaxID=306572 RepID=UPI003FCF2FA9